MREGELFFCKSVIFLCLHLSLSLEKTTQVCLV